MIDKYQKLCEYIMELNEENQIALKKARNEHDIYGNDYFDLLATEDVIYLLKEKMKEINENNV
jgi:predicted Zn-dependent protease